MFFRQKSYGSEKRFFCPPPYVKLTGSGWLSKPPPTIQMSIDDNYSRNSPVDVEADGANSYIARAKFLYISDTDKRKTFFLRVKVTTKVWLDFGLVSTIVRAFLVDAGPTPARERRSS